MAKQTTRGEGARWSAPGGAGRVLRIVLAIFGIAVCGIAVAAWFAGDRPDLEMEYEGFD
jgi:hypothetical protein